MILLSKATQQEINIFVEKVKKENLLIEMRDRYGLLLGVSKNLYDLQNLKNKKGEYLYRVDSNKVLNYDKVYEYLTWDIQLDSYKGKKEILHKYQEKFEKQENYWANVAQKKYSFNPKI